MIKVKIKEQSFIARIAAYKMKWNSAAIVLGKTIHLWNVSRKDFLQNERWLLHELEHVKQYKKLGFMIFIFQYLRESFRNGYYKNRFEVEARQAELERNADDFMFV
ncbi:MAG: DUF4157 domain-containing protein [Chitinophagaceae bacterium]